MRGTQDADAAFAANVRRLREARSMSLRDLAATVGVGHTIIHRIENGQAALLGYAVAISAELGVPLADMTGGDPCGTCFGRPPAGFACLTCGTEGREIAATREAR